MSIGSVTGLLDAHEIVKMGFRMKNAKTKKNKMPVEKKGEYKTFCILHTVASVAT